ASFLGDVRGLKSPKIFDEFVKLKETEKLYRVDPGKLDLSHSPGGPTVARGTFTIPSRIAPGAYEVRLSVLRDGRLLETRTAAFTVRVVGLPALLSGLAHRHGGLYGLLAVAVAVVFGYVTGVVFRRASPRHRDNIGIEAAGDRNSGS
ncbi:MAG: TIGR02186 family protein, partial [bacterium]